MIRACRTSPSPIAKAKMSGCGGLSTVLSKMPLEAEKRPRRSMRQSRPHAPAWAASIRHRGSRLEYDYYENCPVNERRRYAIPDNMIPSPCGIEKRRDLIEDLRAGAGSNCRCRTQMTREVRTVKSE